MAGIYTIGSKLGYDIANGMTPGQTVTVGDGSVWTKNADGTITVDHQGQRMTGQVTYNPMAQQQLPGQALIQQNVSAMPGSTGYTSPYADRLNQVISGLQDSKWEGWDANSDPSMQAYRKQYLREAERSAEDVLGRYAQNTGGIAGSQAIAAATQASDYYKSQLADKVPELYENAYGRYLNEVAQKQNMANLLMNAESQANSQYYQRIDYALTKWGQMGYADQEVASILGVAAGTPTSDQSYTDWSTAFQREQFDYEKQKAAQAAAGKITGGGTPVEDATTESVNQNEVSKAKQIAQRLMGMGRSQNEIVSDMINSGYSEAVIDSVFAELGW